jgi:hypothetical protein
MGRLVLAGFQNYFALAWALAEAPSGGGREDVMNDNGIVRVSRETVLSERGNRLIAEPMPRPSLLELLSTWEPLDEEFPEIDDLGPIEDVSL